ncbi:MAG: LamB/YcsF family protein, partial [Chloroflexi bacterium]|nr:LamB/YcsF family protein [Chloroflexota bacterium]
AKLRFIPEAFADRRYLTDGSLQPRTEPGSLITDADAAAAQAVGVTQGAVTAVDGSRLELRAESICCHGDTPGVVEIAAAVRRAIEAAGVVVSAP